MPGIAELIDARLRDIPDFPQPGVLFKDITPLLADGPAFGAVVEELATRHTGVDLVAGVEARGFVIGAALAHRLGIGFVPVRKAGRLPGETVQLAYDLEYGSATIEVHADAFAAGESVLVVDDVLATGGTAAAACELVEQAGGRVTAVAVVIELLGLGGRGRLPGRTVDALLSR